MVMKTKSGKQISWIDLFIKGTAAFCLLHIISLLPDLPYFIGDQAFVIDDISSVKNSSVALSTHYLWENLQSYLPIVKDDLVIAIIGIYILALVAMIFNVAALPAAIIALLLKIVVNNSMSFYVYGLDGFEVIALFYCVVFVNYHRSDIPARGVQRFLEPKNLLRVLQLHLCIVYFFGGLGKILGHNWWNGESVWKAIHLVDSPEYFDSYALGQYGELWTALGIGTFTLELLYPIGVNFARTRNFFMVGIIGMHCVIGIFIGLHFFSAFMIFLNICAYVFPYVLEGSGKPKTLALAHSRDLHPVPAPASF